MRIVINHRTTYSYDQPMRYGLQELRLTPRDTQRQKILEWKIDAPGMEQALEFSDAWGNTVHLVNQMDERGQSTISVSGVVETMKTDGIVGKLKGENTSRLFVRSTPLTAPNEEISELAEGLRGRHRDHVALYHAMMQAIRERMEFDTSSTHSETTAAEAIKNRHGVCQDFSHVFISICRLLDQPARYVTGYLVIEETGEIADAHHAWVEADVAGLGWVGFDPANGVSPDERYVRLACGLDASTAAPVRGIRRGHGNESLEVSVSVNQSSPQ
ncbi:MAG: transglutaminase family protein [Rhizobiaceae bacterium]